ncbi:dTDP-4-dehydrorhamnose reductase [Mucilaginibacter segetis]|uniref:dTDP-4-dehydrorhamnose reductase n=1 Tax=Mucilaginibacter segetis TaxID=2793071 RepID=A0A934ULS4_9SPHI|nr:dTDP-4-dehydrorhamnose reductase [Mucilaginibacter segetis]MBK0378127.1 dTDP-4-dehydrorhamnose reductase [Mucilaginibacter segetis]
MSKTLVFGASGQLGQCFKKIAEEKSIDSLLFPSEEEANILDIGLLDKLFINNKPDYCINCAAYTAVDKAESDEQAAYKVNKTGVENLSKLCDKYNTTLIHISTDFVFNGDKPSPLNEEDETSPISVYGQTKLDGEQIIPEIIKQFFIIRTGWLYSEYGNNFVKTMLKLGAERDVLKIIADQIGTPTYAMDLADCIINIISSGESAYGIYHYSNEGVASWYDFSKAIFDISKTDVKVLPIPTSDYVTPAKRPAYSVMDKSKVKRTFSIEIPYWRDSLKVCISKLK